jgi:hypothetical protein
MTAIFDKQKVSYEAYFYFFKKCGTKNTGITYSVFTFICLIKQPLHISRDVLAITRFSTVYPPYNLNRFPQTINSRIITNLFAITDFQIHAANLSTVTSAAILVVQTSVIR